MWSVCLVFCDCGFQSVWHLMDKDKRLMEASWWERLTEGKTGLVLMGGAMLSKSLIQFSVDGQGCVPSLLFDQKPNYGGCNEDNCDLIQNVPRTHYGTQGPWPYSRLLQTHASARDSWTLTGKFGSVSCRVTVPFSWVLVHTTFCLYPSRVCFPSPVSSDGSVVGLMATSFKRANTIPRSAAPSAPTPVPGQC